MVKTKGRETRMDPSILATVCWFFCAVSKEPLQEPVVTCGLGKLYNREAVLHYLLDASSFGDAAHVCAHIRSLKDVVALKLEPIDKDGSSAASAGAKLSMMESAQPMFACPISGRPMNGRTRFVALWPCGHVLSEKALREAGSKASSEDKASSTDGAAASSATAECLMCATAYDPVADVIPLNPTANELPALKERLAARAAAAAAEKKSKSKKKGSSSGGKDKEKRSKRKADEALDGADESAPKRQHRAAPTINVSMPALPAAGSTRKSEAIASIYAKTKTEPRDPTQPGKSDDFFVRGTYSRM
ncbi:Replication termination factor 2 [Blastocladiella emersonii ATCC 22665]|nr:Replication termination factor 2 [Blastocladiella emersonii ATCC 22665]